MALRMSLHGSPPAQPEPKRSKPPSPAGARAARAANRAGSCGAPSGAPPPRPDPPLEKLRRTLGRIDPAPNPNPRAGFGPLVPSPPGQRLRATKAKAAGTCWNSGLGHRDPGDGGGSGGRHGRCICRGAVATAMRRGGGWVCQKRKYAPRGLLCASSACSSEWEVCKRADDLWGPDGLWPSCHAPVVDWV